MLDVCCVLCVRRLQWYISFPWTMTCTGSILCVLFLPTPKTVITSRSTPVRRRGRGASEAIEMHRCLRCGHGDSLRRSSLHGHHLFAGSIVHCDGLWHMGSEAYRSPTRYKDRSIEDEPAGGVEVHVPEDMQDSFAFLRRATPQQRQYILVRS